MKIFLITLMLVLSAIIISSSYFDNSIIKNLFVIYQDNVSSTVNPYEFGLWAFPVIIVNLILFLMYIPYQKKSFQQ